MIFFEEKKIAFVFPAKTGSTTAMNFLLQSKLKMTVSDAVKKHLTPKEAKDKYPILKDFVFYSFLRNPVERFVSALTVSAHEPQFKKLITIGSENPSEKADDFLNVLYERNRHLVPQIFFKPQSEYFDSSDIVALDFDNYESELRRASAGLGLENVILNTENKTNYENAGANKNNLIKWLTPYVKKKYAKDFELLIEKFNKSLD